MKPRLLRMMHRRRTRGPTPRLLPPPTLRSNRVLVIPLATLNRTHKPPNNPMDKSAMLSPTTPPETLAMSLIIRILIIIRIVGVVLLLLLVGLPASARGEACLGACDGVIHHLGEALLLLLRLRVFDVGMLGLGFALGGGRGVLEDLLVGTLGVLFGLDTLGVVLGFSTLSIMFWLGDRFGGALAGNGSVGGRSPLRFIGA
jgi:hypothetical protein